MADVLSKAKRSALMAKVRSRGNASTEQRLAYLLRLHRITGWRRGAPLPGKPDFIFHAAKLAVFVDGCFWHGCRHHGRMPKTRVAFWMAKLARNARRDREVRKVLRRCGWRVLRVWEHELARKNEARLARRVQRAITPR